MKPFYKYVLLFILSFSCAAGYAQGWQWAVGSVSSPGVAMETEYGSEASPSAVDRMGNVFVAGTYNAPDSVVLGSFIIYDSLDVQQIFVTKLDSNGNFLWVRTVSVSYSAFCNALGLATDAAGNLYLLGAYDSGQCIVGADTLYDNDTGSLLTEFIAKYSPAGDVLWAKNICATNYINGGIGTDVSGNIYYAGSFSTPVATIGTTTITNTYSGAGNTDMLLARFDSSGNALGASGYGSISDCYATGLSVTKGGNVYVVGSFTALMQPIGLDTLVDSFVTSGSLTSYYYPFIARFTDSLKPVWAYDLRRYMSQCDMTTDQYENIYMTGVADSNYIFGMDTMEGAFNAVVMKYDSSGAMQWFNSARNGLGYSVKADRCGNVWVAGAIEADSMNFDGNIMWPPALNADPMYLAEYDACGNYVSGSAQILGTGGDDAMGIALDDKGSLYAIGDYKVVPAIFGADTLLTDSLASETLFIAKYKYNEVATCVACYPADTATSTRQVVVNTEQLFVFPNPATAQLTIQSTAEPINTISINNILGQAVYSRQLAGGVMQCTVDVSGLVAGVYFVRVNGNTVRKFVKE